MTLINLQLTIRLIKDEDFSQWSVLWEGYNHFYGRSGANRLPNEITNMTWSRFFKDDEPMYALVAESEGQLIGIAHYLFHRSTNMIAPTCYLQDLFTVETLRGKGIGTALINAVGEQAKLKGSSRVYWQTHESNQTAIKLYEKVAERSGFLIFRKQII